MATFVVTNTGDLTPSGAVVPGSLRDAIDHANLNPGANNITFNIGGGGVHTIVISPAPQAFPSPLPAIINSTTIDATTQPGFIGSPLVYINGVDAGNAANGLQIDASNTVVKGLGIENFSLAGVSIQAGSVTLTGNYIGIDSTGLLPRPNGGSGVLIDGQANCQIGGIQPGQSNVISGNRGSGIQLINASAENLIENNFIGTTSGGSAGVPNGAAGILISGSSFNAIGGPGITNGTGGSALPQGNLISGNAGAGIVIAGVGSSGNSVQGNIIGLNAAGGSGVPNLGDGIDVNGAARNAIGGLIAGSGNVISGNGGAGIVLTNASGTAIQGNVIGTDASGTSNLGNGLSGILVANSSGSAIGGSQNGAGNTIAFNGKGTPSGGVDVLSGASVPILGNSIFGNTKLGINLVDPADPASGVTPIHPGGGVPGGPNNEQNYPTLTSGATGAGRTLIQGNLVGAPNSSYTIQFFSNPTADPTNFGQGKTLIGQTALTTDDNGNGTINLLLPIPTTVGQFIAATCTDSQGDTSEFSNDVTIGQANIADTGLTVVANPSPATLGGDIVYTLTVTNAGPSPATGVTVTDDFPTTTTFVSVTSSQGPPPTQNVGSIVADLGTIAPGGTATVTLTVVTNSTGVATNTASVASNEIDPNTLNNSVVTNTQVNIPADIGVSMSASPSPVTVGNQLAYTIIVTNNGPGTATNVQVTDPLPADVTILNVASGQGSSTTTGNTVVTSLGNLPVGVSSAIRILVVPNDVGTLTNTVTATLDEIDPDPSNNTFTLNTTVQAAADLGVTMTASPEPVLVGQNLTYVVTVSNSGPSPATGVTLTDLLPADVNFVSATASQGTASPGQGDVVAKLGEIDPGNTATLTIVVVPTASEKITNQASVTANEFDPNAANNSASIDSTVSPADVGITIEADPSPVLAGNNLTYTLLIKNNGPATADNVAVVDQLPSGVTFVSAAAAQGTAVVVGGAVNFDLGSIASGATVAATIVVIPTAPGSIADSATVSAQEFDPNPDNNSASITTLISPVDLSIATAPSAAGPILVGTKLTYTMTVMNNGPATATNVVVTDALPDGATFVSGTTSQGSVLPEGATVLVPIGIMPSGSAVTVTIVVTPTVVGTATNTAVVSSDQTDTNPADNTAVTTTDVINQIGEFDLSSATYSVLQSSGTAQITVLRNNGSLGAAAIGVTVSAITARPGVDFVPFSTMLEFADGQLSQTINVPILDDGQHGPDRTVLITLENPTNGVPLGATKAAILTIVNVHPDLVGPVVTGTQLLGTSSIPAVVVSFSKPLDASSANNINNYAISGSNGSVVPLRSVAYNPLNNTVIITPMKALGAGSFFVLRINGSTASGLRDTTPAGNLLDGAGNGTNGTDLVESFIRSSSIKYTDAGNNLVTLRLAGGGTMDLIRAASGQGLTLTIINPRAYRSTLSGSVKPGRITGTGSTTLQSITGLRPFGVVKSNLTQPPFFVGNEPSFSPGAISPTALDLLLTSGHLRAAKPKGHHHH
jgi:uncharacterized repeat protein (TIGR01451 family)